MVAVMLVDDAAFIRAFLREILEEAGHWVVAEAGNGREAVEKYKTYRPDLVMLDIYMPVLDGLETLDHIIAFDPRARVVMCTAIDRRNLIVEAMCLGARDYVLKPFQPNRIVAAIDRVLTPFSDGIFNNTIIRRVKAIGLSTNM